MKVTVLGLGIMGQGVAATLLREGFDVTVWNRSPGKASDLQATGASVAGTPREAVNDADVILSILFDADSVLTVFDEASSAVRDGSVWVQASTIGIDGTRRVTRAAEAKGVSLIEAMMLGTKVPAEKGALVMLAAGDAGLIEKASPVLEAMGSKTVVAGQAVGDGSALKLAANAWIASITAATAQSIALAEALGLDGDLFLQAIDGGASDTPYAHTKGATMLAHDYPAQFALDGLRKDVGLITEAASGAGVDVGLLTALSAVYAKASESGHGGDDIAAVYEGFAASR
ncbi:NAD(P)-dependent oxidoreductase [Frondihabitans sp. VKM Ac-2883]|uniref:NAD(P)-dependent oxidoreductase n=1 Tax=Frondihabitans sp. VKM Ac-2883 TaxID=2783823 RepID=UPI00188D9623|nr:NAD(P)-dependent oxidoreductase [Frondihabitans sp. VKM Ac-2883]MBF4575688.1 NAD(P)-dependent oxidoreductase [Frondihabitans sp. VKM Ac-2883]